jgi:tonB-linked outer membrane protein, susC/ragA family
MDRYYLTATFRADGSSRFKKHWAYFPSFAFAWKMKDENKFRDIKWLSDLKLRLGWGMTGQQEGIGDYNYFDIYQTGNSTNGYYPVTGEGIIVRPQAVNKDLTWETTTTYNVGLDWGILNQRLSGSVDWYYRKTTDLLNTVIVPAGSNFRNQVPSNIGSLENTGIEVALRWRAIETKNWYWTIDYNFTYNKNEITDLTGGKDPNFFVATGGISAGTGVNAQAHAVGHPASSFYVYQQIYDKNGKAIEGAVVDRNGDGKITEADKYFYKSPMAPVTMGLSSRLEYKNWDLGFSLRANIGNYVFNDLMAGQANISPAAIWASSEFLSNRPIASVKDNWQTGQTTAILSDRWVQNASFLKLDNVTLGYSFADLFKTGGWHGLSGRVYGTASNILTLTKYKGIDPEVFGGIDNNLYPRPMSFIVGLNLNF